MNIKVNKDKCIGCGQCVAIADAVFDFDDDNQATVIETPVKEENIEAVNTAIENCPTAAIEEVEVANVEEVASEEEDNLDNAA